MGTHQELTTTQIYVLEIIVDSNLDIENGKCEFDDLYDEIWEKHEILVDEFDNAVTVLIEYGYLDVDKKPTKRGENYLEFLRDKAYNAKINKQSKEEVPVKKTNKAVNIIVGIIGVAASVATILGFILSLK